MHDPHTHDTGEAEDPFLELVSNIARPIEYGSGSIERNNITGDLEIVGEMRFSAPSEDSLLSSPKVKRYRELFELPDSRAHEAVTEIVTLMNAPAEPYRSELGRAEASRRAAQENYEESVSQRVLASFLVREPDLALQAIHDYMQSKSLPGLAFEALRRTQHFRPDLLAAAMKIIEPHFLSNDSDSDEENIGAPLRYVASSGGEGVEFIGSLLDCGQNAATEVGFYDDCFTEISRTVSTIAKKYPNLALSHLRNGLTHPQEAIRAITLDVLSNYDELPHDLMDTIGALVSDSNDFVAAHAVDALSVYGAMASSYTKKLMRIAEDDNPDFAGPAIVALGKVGEPREHVVPFLVSLWDEIKDLEDDPEYEVMPEGGFSEELSFEQQIQNALAEVSMMIPRGFSQEGGRDARVFIAPLLKSFGALLGQDREADKVMREAFEMKSRIVRNAVVDALWMTTDFDALAPYLKKALRTPTDIHTLVTLAYSHGEKGEALVNDYMEELSGLEAFLSSEEDLAKIRSQKQAVAGAVAYRTSLREYRESHPEDF